MENTTRTLVLFAAIGVLFALGSPASAQCVLTDPLGSVEVGPGAAEYDFVVTYDTGECFWKPSGTDSSWLGIEAYSWIAGTSGTLDDDKVTYSVTQNTGFERTGKIFVEASEYIVTQLGECQVELVTPPSGVEAVFVAYPGCNAIVRVGQTDTALVHVGPPSDGSLGSTYEGLVYGPDGWLYALDPTRGVIDVFDPNAQETTDPVGSVYARAGASYAFSPRFGRFNLNGDLIVSDADSLGVYQFPKTGFYDPANPGAQLGNPVPVYESTEGRGAGVTFDADGTLLVVDELGSEILRFEDPDGTGEYSSTPVDPISVPTGSLGVGRTANRDVLVASEQILGRYDNGGVSQGACFTFAGDTIISVDPSANDTLHVTVRDSINESGTLYEIPFGYNPCEGQFEFFCGGATPLASFTGPTPSGTAPPIVADVALPFSGRQAYTEMPGCDGGYQGSPIQGSKSLEGGQAWNFFDLYATFEPLDPSSTCEVTISSEEYSPIDIEGVIANNALLQPSRPLVLPGDNGRMRVLSYDPIEGATCPPSPTGDPAYERGVSAFFTRVNPKLALCHAAGLTDCNLQRLKTLDLEFGAIPEDGTLSGFDPSFSEGFLVDQVPPGEYDGVWCGVDPPVSNEEPWLVANAGSVVPIDIKPVLKGDECGDKTIPDLVAVLSIWYVPTGTELPFEDLRFTSSGSAEEYRAVFYEGANPKKPYSLNWDTTGPDGKGLPAGLYKLNIIDDTAATRGTTEIYFPPQAVYIELK